MNEEPFKPPGVQQPAPRRMPEIVPVFIVLGCAVLLTGGAVFGVIATCNFNSPQSEWTPVFFWTALAGLVLVVLCVLFIAAWGVWMIIKKIRGQ